MMVAEAQLAGADCVAGGEHFSALGGRALVGALQAAQRQIDPFTRGLTLDRREALGDDQLVWDPEPRIEAPGAADIRIFLDPEHAREAPLGRAPDLERVEPEADPRIRDVLAEVLLWP